MAGRLLVLDIDDRGIDARTGKEHFFAAWADLPDFEDRAPHFPAALELIAGKLNLKSCDHAIILIASRQACFRNISLPFKHDNKIRQVLPLELAPCLPFPDQPFVFDCLRQDLHFVPDQHLFLTASIPEHVVRQMVSCLMSLKIRPRIVCPKGYALAVCFLENQKQKPDLAFIYTGRSETTLTLVVQGKPVMVRSLPGPDTDNEKTVHAFFQTMTGFRQKTGVEKELEICIAFENSAQKSAEALRTALSQHASVKKAGITMHAIDTESMDLSRLERSRRLLNFCQGRYGAGSFFQKFKTELVILAAIGSIALGLSIYSLQKDISRLEAAIAIERQKAAAVYRNTFPDSTNPGVHAPLLLMQAQVNDALKKTDSRILPEELTNSPHHRAVDVLYELSGNIPETLPVKLSRLLLNRGNLIIAGATDSFYTVDRLKTTLEKSPVFKTVTINTAEAGKSENQVLFNFNITI